MAEKAIPTPINKRIINEYIYHIVFSTKYRRKLIFDLFSERLYEYIGGIIRAQNCHLIEIGGIEDHVHLKKSTLHF